MRVDQRPLVYRVWIWPSVVVSLLTVIASLSGLLVKSIYARETPTWAVQALGQDATNIVVIVPTILVTAYLTGSKHSFKAFLVWIGAMITLAYTYAIACFDVHFNSLFLVYVAILGLSLYTLLGSLIRTDLKGLATRFSGRRTGPVSIFLIILAFLIGFLWLSEDVPAILAGTIPQTVTQNVLPTNPVHVLDLALTLPGMLATGILLWRKSVIGFVAAVPLIVFSVLTGLVIIASIVASIIQGVSTNITFAIFVAIIAFVSLIMGILFLQEID
jgi:hypothetical protein